MKNASTLKSNKIDSPKTPGGISKSLLTPCRRLGLSRNWKKVGPSPFVSPLTGGNAGNSTSAEVKVERRASRKRKERVPEDETEPENEETSQTALESDGIVDVDQNAVLVPSSNKNEELVDTPSRRVEIPRRKRSKRFLSPINQCKENKTDNSNIEVEKQSQCSTSNDFIGENNAESSVLVAETVSTPKQVKSKLKVINNTSPIKSIWKTNQKHVKHNLTSSNADVKENINDVAKQESCEETTDSKSRSPNDLTKECIVVIQKKIFKTDKKNSKTKDTKEAEAINKLDLKNSTPSQTLFDSDTDEVPLCHLNKKGNISHKRKDPQIITIDEDDDFTEPNRVKVKKLEDKTTSTGGLKPTKQKATKIKPQARKTAPEPKPSSQSSNSFDDDEDFEFDNKKTILIRKTYDKVMKPSKAKSTGSITQRDIDELRSKIELKKKLLLAKAMTEETGELRGLIKKWQKGCQDALMELMDLMKSKFPDKQNMEYSEMLQLLKIPVNLVGYDSENDCFTTPEDANIILSKFEDL